MGKWRKRLPRLSRGWRIVRNLALTLVCLYALWARAGYPLPTAELEFRRLERKNLLPCSEIQGIFRDSYGQRTVYGVQGDQVVWGCRSLECWPREEAGPTLFPASEYRLYPNDLLFAAADVPEGTASARLDMTVDCWFASDSGGGTSFSAFEGGYPRDDSLNWSRWTRDYQAEGELLEEGGVLFRVPLGDEDSVVSIERSLFSILTRPEDYMYLPKEQRGMNCRIEAVFFSENGAELDRAALSTPEEENP